MAIFNESDVNNDGLLDLTELEHFIHEVVEFDDHDGHEEHNQVAFATLHIEEEGDYGFALPSGIEYFILMGEGGRTMMITDMMTTEMTMMIMEMMKIIQMKKITPMMVERLLLTKTKKL